MPNSDHLDMPLLVAGQTNPDVTINNFLVAVDNLLGGTVSVDFASDANLTLTAAQNREMQIEITDTGVVLTAARDVILDSLGRFHIVLNSTAQDLTFKNATGTGVTVATGAGRELIFNDGTNVYSVSGQGSDAFLYEVAGFVDGSPSSSQDILRFIFTRAVDFPSGLTGSQGYATTQATSQADFDIQKNGSSVGTMRFPASTSAATFIMASATSFAAGDRLEIIAPGSVDATLADIFYTLKGTRA